MEKVVCPICCLVETGGLPRFVVNKIRLGKGVPTNFTNFGEKDVNPVFSRRFFLKERISSLILTSKSTLLVCFFFNAVVGNGTDDSLGFHHH